MPEKDSEFATLMERVQAGSDEAAQQLHELYGQHILRAVRRRLHAKLRSKYDSLDFVQDVWASFFTDIPQKRVFARPEDLVAFLSRMAQNKVRQAVRTRLKQQKYNVNRERPLETPSRPEFLAQQATVSEIAMGREEWDQLLARQPPVHRRVLLSWRDGKSSAQIAQDMGISQKTVDRVLRKALSGDGS
jgi:RNA polymerase sigma factor (sigma-70 family)